ncbi:MAG: cupin domain-containing protein [Alphaproteobacteria bacterium]|nr:cupin domain-containing protein [Alphaproteobacteria bacterium]
MNFRNLAMIGAALAMGALGLAAAYAQSNNPFNSNGSQQVPGTKDKVPANLHAVVTDKAGNPPDPKHIPFTLPANIKWRPNGPPGTKPGEADIANVYGDPDKPGPYAVLYRWHQGAFSRPHYHDKVRHIVVLSGTWWVSSSTTYDEKTTYPLHAGATATDEEYAIHWDGTRTGEKEPAVIYLYGEGPVATVSVDEKGMPYPPKKK